MVEGRSKEAWNHTADLMATIFNVAPFLKRQRLATREDFHPGVKLTAKTARRQMLKIADLKHYVKGGKKPAK